MAGFLGKITSLVSGYLNDPAKLQPIIAKAFASFDHDNSGFIEGPEVKAAAEKVLSMGGMTSIPSSYIDTVFARVAGPDQKLDVTEFTELVKQLLAQVQAADAPSATA